MTPAQYIAALKDLGLEHANAPQWLGISMRQSFRYAAGTQQVSAPVCLLLERYRANGLPPEEDSKL
jgi:hypothetical protein